MRKKLRSIGVFIVALSTAVASFMSGPIAHATPVITEYYISTGYSTTNRAAGIIQGSDGALWFANNVGVLGRVTTSGVFTAYPINDVRDLTKDASGNLWTSTYNYNKVYEIANDGSIAQQFTPPSGYTGPVNVTYGSDGNLWMYLTVTASGGHVIAKMTPTGTFTTYTISHTVNDMTLGPDGNIWFTGINGSNGTVGYITSTGSETQYVSTHSAGHIATGPDGNLWVTGTNYITRVTPTGTVTDFSLTGNTYPTEVTAGPDGNVWYSASNTGLSYPASVGRVTPTGTVTVFPVTSNSGPQPLGITTGPDGTVWFTESMANRIGKVTINPPSPASGLTAAASLTNGNNTLSWTAGAGATSYDVYRDSVKVGSSATTTYTDNNTTDGNHTYYVIATNPVGSSTASNSVTVTSDRVAPAVSITTPTNGATVSGTVTFTGSVSDTHFGFYTYSVNDGVSVAVPSVADWTAKSNETVATFDTTTVPNGTYYVTFVARDSVGNYTVQERQIVVAN